MTDTSTLNETQLRQQRRFSLYELMLDTNNIGPGALHAVLAEASAIIEYGQPA